jgi:hypothetical protein
MNSAIEKMVVELVAQKIKIKIKINDRKRTTLWDQDYETLFKSKGDRYSSLYHLTVDPDSFSQGASYPY